MEPLYYNISSETVTKIFNSDEVRGLSKKEAAQREVSFGKNVLEKNKNNSYLKIFFNQFQNPLMYILIFAGIVTLFLASYTDAVVIFLAIIINACFGFWEEKKISNILEKLKNTLKTTTTVIRNGIKKEINETDLVPGDIIYLKAGKKIPADARLIQSNELRVSESIMTGEWLAKEKNPEILPKETVLVDRNNMVYMGSLVENGTGTAVVVSTGIRTEAGKLATLIESIKEPKTPLQKKVLKFSKILSIFILIITFIIFISGTFLRDLEWINMFETSVAIAVGAIPESFPIVMTIILAFGAEKILRKQGLIRKLSSVETLSSAQIICFDKTKTLTEGKMKLNNVISEHGELALKTGVLCSDAYLDENNNIIGSPTGIAFFEAATSNNLKLKELLEIEEINKMPFNSENKYSLSLRKEGNKRFLYISGAPERLIKKSKNASLWEKEIERLAEKGLRVVGVGYKEIKKTSKDLNKIANDFTFIGLLSFIDPLRSDAKDAIETCKKAGIQTILATGDHLLTAKTIAEQIGLEVAPENIIDGKELDSLSDAELTKRLPKINVFARVEPRHKLRIVDLWQKKGKIIAMTGDGINDAPAIKQADIGIALGSGTDVAKEASDLILLNDDFGTIVKTVEEGRIALDNLRKSLSYSLADSFSSIILIGFSTIIFGWPLPILAVQLLWNNLIEDTFPGMAFSFEPKENNVMERKPTQTKDLMTKEMKFLIFTVGIIDEFFLLIAFYFLYFVKGFDLDYIRTTIFAIMSIDTIFVIFCFKNLRKNLWKINIFSNPQLNFACLFVLTLCLFAVYSPIIQSFLKTIPLDAFAWAVAISVSLLSVIGIELVKFIFISKKNTEN